MLMNEFNKYYSNRVNECIFIDCSMSCNNYRKRAKYVFNGFRGWFVQVSLLSLLHH